MANNTIVTIKARQNMVLARAGEIDLPPIAGMVFGDGGVDESGEAVAPSENQSALKSEIYRKVIDGYTVLEDEDATVRYICTLQKNEAAGQDISEIGLYDENGDLVCIKTFKAKGKDDDLEMTFSLDDIF